MSPTPEAIDITGYPLIPLEKAVDGYYPFPRERYGILPYYINHKDEIVWGCIESNRVEPITFAPAAGTQDIIAIKNGQRLVLESGKPLPDLYSEFNFLHEFKGKLFRDEAYQGIIGSLITNGFSVYLENPIATAIHEAYEEHGIDLRKTIGRDNRLLKTPLELSAREQIQPEIGVASLCLWLPELTGFEDINLRYTNKIDKKMRRNFGREFYEKGSWITLEDFKTKLIQEKEKFSSLENYTPVKIELITQAFRAFELNQQLLERIELSLLTKRHPIQQKQPPTNQNVSSKIKVPSTFFTYLKKPFEWVLKGIVKQPIRTVGIAVAIIIGTVFTGGALLAASAATLILMAKIGYALSFTAGFVSSFHFAFQAPKAKWALLCAFSFIAASFAALYPPFGIVLVGGFLAALGIGLLHLMGKLITPLKKKDTTLCIAEAEEANPEKNLISHSYKQALSKLPAIAMVSPEKPKDEPLAVKNITPKMKEVARAEEIASVAISCN